MGGWLRWARGLHRGCHTHTVSSRVAVNRRRCGLRKSGLSTAIRKELQRVLHELNLGEACVFAGLTQAWREREAEKTSHTSRESSPHQ